MKITCDIALDLLSLYSDGETSSDSTRAVENHLSECENCRKYYKLLKKKKVSVENSDTADSYYDISYEQTMIRLGKRIRNSIIYSAASALLIATACSVAVFYISSSKFKK